MQAARSFLFILLICFSQQSFATGKFGINAYKASEIICNINGQFKSQFSFNRKRKSWTEKTADGQKFYWQEAMRDEWSIYLDDRQRGFFMQLDLHTTKVSYGRNGNRQQNYLCKIVSARAKTKPPKPNNKGKGKFCAKEHQICQFKGEGTVTYGADKRWVSKRLRGPVKCNNQTFGDPARGTLKACYVKSVKPIPEPFPKPKPRPKPLPKPPGGAEEAKYDIKNVGINGMSARKTDELVKWVIAESMRQEQPMCWKKSKTNTAGKPLSSCPANKTKSAGLCYNKCKKGYVSDGAMLCYKKCPKGTKTSPGFCHYKFGSIGSCPKPLKGLKPACINSNSYSRGIGKPMTCARGQVQKGALCYPQCPSGYSHGGPVCWQTCSGSHPVDCGAGCSKSSAQCAKEITNMVLATGELVANIAGFALTGGTANAGMKSAKTAMRSGQKVAARIALKKALQSSRQRLSQRLTNKLGARVFAYVGKKSGRKNGSKLVRDYSRMVFERASQKLLLSQMSQDPTLAEVAAMIDPTGVVDVVNAYNKPICNPVPMPR